MSEYGQQGTWAEIHKIILEPHERAPQVPEDTKQVPLEMRIKGFLASNAKIGEEATIITPAGRRVSGTLMELNPAYTHQFGPPIPELLPIGRELRDILSEKLSTGETDCEGVRTIL